MNHKSHSTSSSDSDYHSASLPSSNSMNNLTRPGGPGTKRGKLKKKGFWSAWKECYFVLEGGLLLEYKTENSSKPNKVIHLDKYSIKLADSISGATHSFMLIHYGEKDKETLFLCAPNEPEKVEWVSAISTKCQESTIDWGTDSSLEAFNDGVVEASEKGIIIGVNEAALKLFGWKRSEMIGKTLDILMPREYGSEHHKYVDDYLEKGIKRLLGKPRKLPAIRADGSRIMIILSLGEVFTGGIRKFIAMIRPDDTKTLTQENVKQNFEIAIDKAFNQACIDLKDAMSKDLMELYQELEQLRAENKILRKKTESGQSSKKLLRNNMPINLVNVSVNEKLGDGGSGTSVYACTVDGFNCAMKELELHGVDHATIEGFTTEINLIESLPYHKNLVRYLFHTQNNTKIRLFMTRYSCNLTQIIKQRRHEGKHFTLEEVVKFMLDMVKGLEILHEHNIIHRDLKSDNIFVTINSAGAVDCLVIGDFDTAKQINQDAVAKTCVGTPGYIAPEILQSKNKSSYGFAADIWGLGMVMYEVLALQRPYSDQNVFAVANLTLQGSLPTLKGDLLEKYEPLIETWKQCLKVEPNARPTIPELKSTLIKLL